MTKKEIRKTTITLTTEERKTLSSAFALMAQLVNNMCIDEETYTLYCEVEEDCYIDYSVDKIDRMADILYTIANNPLEIA